MEEVRSVKGHKVTLNNRGGRRNNRCKCSDFI